jgi:hypothetical protein
MADEINAKIRAIMMPDKKTATEKKVIENDTEA